MDARFRYRKKSVYVIVALIIVALVGELLLTKTNENTIQRNVELQKQAEAAKVNTLDIIRNVHLLDLSLRGYALNPKADVRSTMDSTIMRNREIFQEVEQSLKTLNYPVEELHALKKSTEAYLQFTLEIRDAIDHNEREKFLAMFAEDRGLKVWIDHRKFSGQVNVFCDRVAAAAKKNYENAERAIYLLQLVLLIIVVPTLLYTAYFSNQTVNLAQQLQKTQRDKAAILEKQNTQLEQAVAERTREILAQNEEITAQNEEILSHNEQLTMQQNKIEEQSMLLQQRNLQLEKMQTLIYEKNVNLSSEVGRQTEILRAANKELLEQNTRLEQFAYIISHNLRAPIARLIGLTSIADPKNPVELVNILDMINHSSNELDGIVKDLTGVLSIQRLSHTQYSKIDLPELIAKLKSILHNEIEETGVSIHTDFKSPTLFSLNPYVESIFLNLLSNSIKYRNPDRPLRISLRSFKNASSIHVEVEDNGIGIDLAAHRDSIFNLYKRFHFHVEGKGLGLYLVKTQVEALGGTIDVRSKINEGTTFALSFPLTPAH